MRTDDLAHFMKSREAARVVHDGGKRPKVGLDPIIATYRFCNMDRNDDRVTKDIYAWAKQYHDNPDLWFVFVVARLFNNRPVLDLIAKCVLPYRPEPMRKILAANKAQGNKTFNAAYIVSTNGLAMDKVDYVLDRVLAPIWAARKTLRPINGETLAGWHANLSGHQGMGSFMAAQVIADLKYQPGPLELASDFATFASSGPGSRRGLNRVLDQPKDAPWRELAWRGALTALRSAILPKLRGTHLEGITAQNLQNCLCEFDKYERARTGDGAPKQLYNPWKGA